MMGCALTSIAASVLDVKHYLHLQVRPRISLFSVIVLKTAISLGSSSPIFRDITR